MWSPFLEKVWAKTLGDYEFTTGGDATEVISFFLNAPFRRFNF